MMSVYLQFISTAMAKEGPLSIALTVFLSPHVLHHQHRVSLPDDIWVVTNATHTVAYGVSSSKIHSVW